MISKYEKTNGVKLFALVAVLAMVFASAAVMIDDSVDAAGELNLSGTINGTEQTFGDGAVGVMNGNLLVEEGKSLIIESGAKFTVQSGFTLTIDKSATLVVMQGAEFIVDGDIVVKNGGVIQNNATGNGFQLNGNLTVEKGGILENYTNADSSDSKITIDKPNADELTITTNESRDVATGTVVVAGGTEVDDSGTGIFAPNLSGITYHMNAIGSYGYWAGVKIVGNDIVAGKTYTLNINGNNTKDTADSTGALYIYTVAGKILDVTISGEGIENPYHFILDMTNVGIKDTEPKGQIVLGSDSAVEFKSTKTSSSSVAGQIFTLENGATLDLNTKIADGSSIIVETLSGENIINASVKLSGTGTVTDLTFGTEFQRAGTVWTSGDGGYTEKSTKYSYSILTVSGDVGTGVTLNINSTVNKIAQPDKDEAAAGVPVYGIVKVAEGGKLTVGEGAAFTTAANSLLQVAGTVNIDGKKASSTETQTNVYAKVTLAGIIEVSGTLDFGEYVSAADTNIVNDASAYLVITGKATFGYADADPLTDFKGVYGVVYEDASKDDLLTISTLEAAFAVTDISEVTTSGYPEDKANYMLEKPFEVSADITIPEINLIINNKLVVKEGVTLTVSEGTDMEASAKGGLIVVEGTVMDYSMYDFTESTESITANTLGINAEVRSTDADDTYFKYTSLADALTGTAGTVTLFGEVKIEGTVTIPEGFTIEQGENKDITILNDSTLIVNGVIDSGTSQIILTKEVIGENAKKAGMLTVNNMIVNPATVDSASTGVVVAGFTANGTIGDYENADFLLSPAVAAANSANLYDITSQGKLSYSGDLTFTAGENNEGDDITIGGTEVSISKIVLNGFGLQITATESFTGTVEAAVTAGTSSVAFNKASGYAIGIDTDSSGETDVTSMTLGVLATPAPAGGVTVATGTVEITGTTMAFGASKDKTLTVAAGATLVVPEKTTLNIAKGVTAGANDDQKFSAVVIDGTLEIEDGGNIKYGTNGTNVAIVEINGTMNVAENTTLDDVVYVEGTLAVAENTTVTVAGSMQVNGTVTGATAFDSGYIVAYAGASVDTANMALNNGVSNAGATAVYINGDLYLTVYSVKTAIASDAIKAGEYDIVGYEDITFDGSTPTKWYTDADYKTALSTTATMENTASVYAKIAPENAEIQLSVGQGMSVYIDGIRVDNMLDANGYIPVAQSTVGTHTIEVTINPGYTGTVNISFNGQAITGGTFEVTPEMAAENADSVVLSVTGNISYDTGSTGDDGGMGLTEILLIILVILIVVMAIMVALRLMRS